MRTGRFGLVCFSGHVGCKLNWPLPLTKSAVIFREFLAVNPSSLYPGSCSFGLWLPSTPQFGGFIAYHNFCFVIFIMLRFLEVDKIFCILLRLNANREIGPPTKAVFGGLGLRWHKRTFFDTPSF